VGAQDVAAFRTWLGWYLAAFTEGVWTLHDLVGEGEKVVVRYSGQTTYRGGLLDIPATNQRVTEMGVLIFRMVEGRVQELWSALCDLDLVLALGAVPVVPADDEGTRDKDV
jgi:predicted ester cyclase